MISNHIMPKPDTNNIYIHLAFALLPFLLLRQSPAEASAAVSINVIDLGAKPDCWTDSTNALRRAWAAACASPSAATIHVPPGHYLVGSLHFEGPCNSWPITIRIDGTLVGPSDGGSAASGDAGNWLLFEEVDGLDIVGGTLDGRGAAVWACKLSGENCPTGATSLVISKSKDVTITGLTSLNSQLFHIVVNGCHRVRLRNVAALAAGNSPNTDGIHVQLSSDVAIADSTISTGDDCVSVGPGTTDLWIENVACGPGHGISIGSLGKEYEELGVRNVTVQRVTFRDTQNGVRIKTWARPSKGYVKDVVFRHVAMSNVENPIVIDQNYCPHNKDCPGEVSGVEISDVTYEDIHGTSATEVAVKFDCSKGSPCKGIRLGDVSLSYGNREPQAWCSNAAGSVFGSVQPSSCLY